MQANPPRRRTIFTAVERRGEGGKMDQLMLFKKSLGVFAAALAALLFSPAPVRLQAQPTDPCFAAISLPGSTALRAAQSRETKHGRLGTDSRDIRDLLQLDSVASQARSRGTARKPGQRPIATTTTSPSSRTRAAT